MSDWCRRASCGARRASVRAESDVSEAIELERWAGCALEAWVSLVQRVAGSYHDRPRHSESNRARVIAPFPSASLSWRRSLCSTATTRLREAWGNLGDFRESADGRQSARAPSGGCVREQTASMRPAHQDTAIGSHFKAGEMVRRQRAVSDQRASLTVLAATNLSCDTRRSRTQTFGGSRCSQTIAALIQGRLRASRLCRTPMRIPLVTMQRISTRRIAWVLPR